MYTWFILISQYLNKISIKIFLKGRSVYFLTFLNVILKTVGLTSARMEIKLKHIAFDCAGVSRF